MILERLFYCALCVALVAVLALIVLINMPPAPPPAATLTCAEWREHVQIQKDVGPTGSIHRTCTRYERNRDE